MKMTKITAVSDSGPLMALAKPESQKMKFEHCGVKINYFQEVMIER